MEDLENSRLEGTEGSAPGAAHFVPLAEIHPAPLSPVAEEEAEPDLAAIRGQLAQARGKQYWRSLEQLSNSPAFQRYLEREFPMQAPRDMAPLSRREFFRVMGATLVLAGAVGGCGYQPPEKIVPYVDQPENVIPGKPSYYATAFTKSGYGIGVLGESHLGRPVKLEGNPDHPGSMGATDAITQGSLLTLYDPDRSQNVRHMGGVTTWENFLGSLETVLQRARRKRGAGLWLVVGATSSPTLQGQIARLLKRYPGAKVVYWDPVSRENVLAGLRQALGRDAEPVYHFDKADRVLSLDCNFLQEEPGSVRYARDFIARRLVREGVKEMNRLYVVESTLTITGAKADHRLPAAPSQIEAIASAVSAGVGAGGGAAASAPAGVPAAWIKAVVDDLQAARGRSIVIAGQHQPPAVHALAHSINQALDNVGTTVTYGVPVVARSGDPVAGLKALVVEMNANRVDTLCIIDANPVYTAPADLKFGEALENLSQNAGHTSIHLGLYDDETGILCQWHLPLSHYLEAWGDTTAHDGTISIVQPLITPLYRSRSPQELLSILLEEGDRPGLDIVREHWMEQRGARPKPGAAPNNALENAVSPEFEKFWQQVLVSGVVPAGGAPGAAGGAGAAAAAGAAASAGAPPPAPAAGGGEGGGMELALRPDPHVWDGSFANNAWLQELPKPLNQLTWDNAAIISPNTAKQLGLVADPKNLNQLVAAKGQIVELQFRGQRITAAAWIQPGQPDNTVTLTLGYGRSQAGRVGDGTGFNAYALRTSDALWGGPGLQVRKTGDTYNLASAQAHFVMEGRELVQEGTLEEFNRNPARPEFLERGPESEQAEEAGNPGLYSNEWPSDRVPQAEGAGKWEGKKWEAKGPVPGQDLLAWGMVIDLTACIGCSACTIACQAENNIATVGKHEVLNNREMHWIRIDNYYTTGDPERDHPADFTNPETVFQPVPCMHCEKAPCEPVCPVEATSHSAEGINEMTYNRCIGTRYCLNNCPYKVRRFNYLQWSDMETPTIQMMRNPDVTVRARGVMEKCTYCVQRTVQGRIQAEKEGRPIRDGDVVAACAQACPTQAIVFGNINDDVANGGKGSKVRQLKEHSLNYTLLTELNTRPRTSYLAQIRNPNPALGGHAAAAGAKE